MADFIRLRGAREHNLKNVNIDFPKGKISVLTGLSGSGKSSLAFDTLLAESQRRFFDTLSHYARQYLSQGSRPLLDHAEGLAPAIALAQNETQVSSRASVGSLSDLTELLGVLFARFGEQHCPEHGTSMVPSTPEHIAEQLVERFEGKELALCAPLVEEKTGSFQKLLRGLERKGFARVWIDGKYRRLFPLPVPARDKKHTIKAVIDCWSISEGSRLLRSVNLVLREGSGVLECLPSKGELKVLERFSVLGTCPECSFSWPELDPRYFSPNSLGCCETCNGLGDVCCSGSGLNPLYSHVLLGGKGVRDLHRLSLHELGDWLSGLRIDNAAFVRVHKEMLRIITSLCESGLGYLSMQRRLKSLSGGEGQRLRLAGILGQNLRGVIYVLDEPSQGLHGSELETLWASLCRLRAAGNTLVLVDHDMFLIQRADLVIDMGPGGGREGGEVVAIFAPQDAEKFREVSSTAAALLGSTALAVPKSDLDLDLDTYFEFMNLDLHNLQIPRLPLPFRALTAVSGVSGAGKTSLVFGSVFPRLEAFLEAGEAAGLQVYGDGLQRVRVIDRNPVGRSALSIPATYLDIYTLIRQLFARLSMCQVLGLQVKDFALHRPGGRCEQCGGRGYELLSMRFLADAQIVCSACQGQRFQGRVLELRYRGLSLAEVLALSLSEALEFFARQPKIRAALQPAVDLGLGYLQLGQSSTTLSGGEAQRLQLVPFMMKKRQRGTLLILDEPTQGLHNRDVDLLLKVLHAFVERGNGVLVIEHHPEVIAASDWVVDLGPGAASAGGRLLYAGPPAGLKKEKRSVTRRYLKV